MSLQLTVRNQCLKSHFNSIYSNYWILSYLRRKLTVQSRTFGDSYFYTSWIQKFSQIWHKVIPKPLFWSNLASKLKGFSWKGEAYRYIITILHTKIQHSINVFELCEIYTDDALSVSQQREGQSACKKLLKVKLMLYMGKLDKLIHLPPMTFEILMKTLTLEMVDIMSMNSWLRKIY